jgi:hypothetical protein
MSTVSYRLWQVGEDWYRCCWLLSPQSVELPGALRDLLTIFGLRARAGGGGGEGRGSRISSWIEARHEGLAQVLEIFGKWEAVDFARAGSKATEDFSLMMGPLESPDGPLSHTVEPFLRQHKLPVKSAPPPSCSPFTRQISGAPNGLKVGCTK